MDLNLDHGWQLSEQDVEKILKQLETQHSFKTALTNYLYPKMKEGVVRKSTGEFSGSFTL